MVFIAALPPGGLAQTGYLCKRVRSQFADLKIIVIRAGLTENGDKLREKLLSAGASQVVVTLIEARSQLLPSVSIAA